MIESTKMKLKEVNKAIAGVLQTLNNRLLLVAPWIETCYHGSEEGQNNNDKELKVASVSDTPHLVASLLPNGNHKLTLDIDLPCRLEESVTPGKFHLFIDKELTADQYDDILLSFYKAGIVEKGVYKYQFQKQGFTAVRLPGIKKTVDGKQIAKPGTWKPDSQADLLGKKPFVDNDF